jgi:hypothetical protein
MARLQGNKKLQGKETSAIHRFESAGLGKAPFVFTGRMTEKTYCACPGAPVQAGSTCDYCGTCIRYEFWVSSADGKEFKVGCDCIHKTGDAGLIRQISIAERKLRDMKNMAAKKAKADRITRRVAAAVEKLSTVRGKLSELAHPNSYWASEGKTMLDYVIWCLENRHGERAATIIERTA